MNLAHLCPQDLPLSHVAERVCSAELELILEEKKRSGYAPDL